MAFETISLGHISEDFIDSGSERICRKVLTSLNLSPIYSHCNVVVITLSESKRENLERQFKMN